MFRVDINPCGSFFRTAGHVFERLPWAVSSASSILFGMTEYDRKTTDVEVVRLNDDGTETTVWRNGVRI